MSVNELWIREQSWIDRKQYVLSSVNTKAALFFQNDPRFDEVHKRCDTVTLARCDCENWKTQQTERAVACVRYIVTQSISLLPLRRGLGALSPRQSTFPRSPYERVNFQISLSWPEVDVIERTTINGRGSKRKGNLAASNFCETRQHCLPTKFQLGRLFSPIVLSVVACRLFLSLSPSLTWSSRYWNYSYNFKI